MENNINVSFHKNDRGEVVAVPKKNKPTISRQDRKIINKINKKLKKKK